MPLFYYIIAKDIRLLLMRTNGILQSIMLGILLVVVFSLSQNVGIPIQPQTAATLFILASVFCVILLTNALFALEQEEGIYYSIMLSSLPTLAFAFGKWFAMFILLLLTQSVLLPVTLILFSQTVYVLPSLLLGIIILNAGIVTTGIILGVITQQASAKDSLMTVLLFPLLLPLLLATIRIIEYALSLEAFPIFSWIGIGVSFVLFFFVALVILFPLLYTSK